MTNDVNIPNLPAAPQFLLFRLGLSGVHLGGEKRGRFDVLDVRKRSEMLRLKGTVLLVQGI